jgi:hypothetical protein
MWKCRSIYAILNLGSHSYCFPTPSKEAAYGSDGIGESICSRTGLDTFEVEIYIALLSIW